MKAKKIFIWVKTIVILIALIVLFKSSEIPFSNLWYIAASVILGYIFGIFTCGIHLHKKGVWITIIIFALLNLIHSAIDGVVLLDKNIEYRKIAVIGHEFIRQPSLYILIWAMLTPFNFDKYLKILLSIVAVTGIWVVGLWLGSTFTPFISKLASLDEIIGYSIFFFVGDIIHHLFDDFLKISNNENSHSHKHLF